MIIPNEKVRFRHGVISAVITAFGLMIFALTVGFYDQHLHIFGIRPRTVVGVVGIFTAPVLHADFQHLISNLFPLILALPGLFYFYYKEAIPVLIVVYILSGFWVWLSARDSVHLGASGVVNGLLAFLFLSGLIKMNRAGFALAAAIFLLYGVPIISGFFPSPGISYESHIAGATAGAFMAVFYGFSKVGAKKPISSISSSYNEEITFQYHFKPNDDSQDKV